MHCCELQKNYLFRLQCNIQKFFGHTLFLQLKLDGLVIPKNSTMFKAFGEGYLCLLKRFLFLSIHRLYFIQFIREIYMEKVLQEPSWTHFLGAHTIQMIPKYIWSSTALHLYPWLLLVYVLKRGTSWNQLEQTGTN